MLIEFSSVINSINNSIYSVPIFNKILSNVIYTAIVLSIILVIVLIFIYPCKENTSGWILMRLFIYVGIINTIILAAFQNTVSTKCKEKYMDKNSSDFITIINSKTGGAYSKDIKKVVPNLQKTKYDSDNDSDIEITNDEHKKEITVADMLDNMEAQV